MKNNSSVYNVNFDKNINAVAMEWTGYATSSEFREGTELMLNTLIKNNCEKVLANIKEMIIIGSDDQQWLNGSFLPRAIKFGFKTIAIIKPESYFNKVAVHNISETIDKKNLNIVFFDSMEEATQWLKTIN